VDPDDDEDPRRRFIDGQIVDRVDLRQPPPASPPRSPSPLAVIQLDGTEIVFSDSSLEGI
jgi:hypothetical protein